VARRLIVTGPRITPASPTIIDYVQWVDETSPNWRNGITYQVSCGNVNSTTDFCVVSGTGGPNPTKAATATVNWRGATPFTLYGEIDCSPVGFWDQAEKLTADQFAIIESREVEDVFVSGVVGSIAGLQMPHLAANSIVVDPVDTMITLQTAATTVTGGVLSPAGALGVIEESLGRCYTGVGVIYVGVKTFDRLIADLLIFRENGRYKTALGNWVVPMRGATMTSPAGVAPGTNVEWMYATGALFGYRGDIRQVAGLTQSFDRNVNTLKMIVERTYVLGWDCCHLAVQVFIDPVAV
jgi:hypothetical protein